MTIVDYRFDGICKVRDVEVLAAEVAKKAFNQIVAKLKDPALLEFAGMNLLRSSVIGTWIDSSQF